MATRDWTELDVDLAEKYRDLLMEIKELEAELGFTEEDVNLAEKYAAALGKITEQLA